MNIFKKVINFFRKKEEKPKQKKTKPEKIVEKQIETKVEKVYIEVESTKPFDEQLCNLVIKQVLKRKKNLNDRPEELSKQEWKKILIQIYIAFKELKQPLKPSSPGKRQILEKKYQIGLNLFTQYIKKL
jgi:hypothetical protein